MDNGNFFIRRTSFIPDDPEHMKEYDADMLQSLLEFDNDITQTIHKYIINFKRDGKIFVELSPCEIR